MNLCPICKVEPRRSLTSYGVRLDCCGLWAWGDHPLTDADTHKARRNAHTAFDSIWREGLMSRSKAYKLLANELNIPIADCHMKLMTFDQASQVPEAARRIRSIINTENNQ